MLEFEFDDTAKREILLTGMVVKGTSEEGYRITKEQQTGVIVNRFNKGAKNGQYRIKVSDSAARSGFSYYNVIPVNE
jgi:hypothetical protein